MSSRLLTAFSTSIQALPKSTPRLFSTFTPTPDPSFTRLRRMCSVPMYSWLKRCASWLARAKTLRARSVNRSNIIGSNYSRSRRRTRGRLAGLPALDMGDHIVRPSCPGMTLECPGISRFGQRGEFRWMIEQVSDLPASLGRCAETHDLPVVLKQMIRPRPLLRDARHAAGGDFVRFEMIPRLVLPAHYAQSDAALVVQPRLIVVCRVPMASHIASHAGVIGVAEKS